jgi:hypothetical protein
MRSKNTLNIIILACCIIIAAFLLRPSIASLNNELDEMREITITDEFKEIRLTKKNTSRPDRAAIVIGDTIYLWKTYKTCDPQITSTLGDIDPPFFVSKESGKEVITVRKDGSIVEYCADLK